MSGGFPWLIASIGAVALAALLYALQQLRARPRVVALPGAMLWARAVEQAPLRVLRQRFRYWLAWLLALAIALLLWFAGLGAHFGTAADARDHVFYLDASAAMTGDTRFAEARAALIADADAVPAERRRVVLGDGNGTLLLAPGENIGLLAHRLQGVSAQALPSGFADWEARNTGPDTVIRYYGYPAGLGARKDEDGLTAGWLAAPVPDNRGIVQLGVSPARSGAWDKADAHILAIDAQGRPLPADALRFERDGSEFTPETIVAASDGAVELHDLDANGKTLTVSLRQGDGFAADNSATVRIPARGPIKVALGNGVPAAVARVVALDPALVRSDAENAQVIVRGAGDDAAPDLPALTLTSPTDTRDSFVFSGDMDSAALARQADAFGLARIDTEALGAALSRPVTVGLQGGERRGIAVWRSVFAPDNGFSDSREMPLFVSQSLHWLADPAPWISTARAGRMLHARGESLPEEDMPPLGPAGDTAVDGHAVSVSLLDRAVTTGVALPAPEDMARAPLAASGRWPLFFWLCLGALVLLGVEWWLVQKGRMP